MKRYTSRGRASPSSCVFGRASVCRRTALLSRRSASSRSSVRKAFDPASDKGQAVGWKVRSICPLDPGPT